MLEEVPMGFVEPEVCNNIKWINVVHIIINGRMKWMEKNRVKVGPSIVKPPHNHKVIGAPI